MQYGLQRVLSLFAPAGAVNTMENFNHLATGQVRRVIQQMKAGAASSGLFFSYVMEDPDAKKLISETEATIEGRMILIAGAEFLGLSFISASPSAYQKIVEEIRSTFSSEDEMTNEAVAVLKYTNAVLKEVFRIYPPTPGTIPRVTPAVGAKILGQYVPGNTVIGVSLYSASHSPSNFHLPEQFVPERWLAKDSEIPEHQTFVNDKLEASQPFSYGPRSSGAPPCLIEFGVCA
ncbi:cytochrome P450 [Aspergillus insuetus]